MILLSLAVFAFSSWAVFSHKFDDGLVVKNILCFAAILAFIAILDQANVIASVVSATLLAAGMFIWCLTHRSFIKWVYAHRPHKAR